ncbi:hypothetical protein THRCLA_11433 [Thraustotheca clavata]|uniref:Mediator of RNA polymerase II transcription subunit 17 n=1 Tax=Thraustotheca clavata TaxID=74557 RepID=A0A1V9Y7W2_9STRA|nr:hypothetical protein THRCLA_11433 [Thraustotheca clavata]
MESTNNVVALFPSDAGFSTIEAFHDDGIEVPLVELDDAQLYDHVMAHLERRRVKSKRLKIDDKEDMKNNEEDEGMENEEDVIDPRIHYRPIVAELQAARIELQQLIGTIDLVRKREYMEEVYCKREQVQVKEKREDLNYLLASKEAQINEAANILTKGANSLHTSVQKERLFFKGTRELLGKWNICAPLHGTIPKPFRAGEPLAIDCSFNTAGSTFVPPTMTLNEVAYAELSRTALGLVRVTFPEFHLQRTLQVELRSTATSELIDSYTLPFPCVAEWEKAEYDSLTGTNEDVGKLEEHNQAILLAVQHSVFCQETFQTIMQEALLPSAKWAETLYPIANYTTPLVRSSKGQNSKAPLSMSAIKDDQIQVHMDQHHLLTIRLVENVPESMQSTNGLCHLATTLLLQEIRKYHVRSNQAKRPTMYTAEITPPQPHALQTVVHVLSHALLKKQIVQYLDTLVATLCKGTSEVRILDDGLCQPRCDSVRGVFLMLRWKVCPHMSTLASLEITIGKNYHTEVVINGTRIQCEDDAMHIHDLFGVDAFKNWIETIICQQVTIALYQDAKAMGNKKLVLESDQQRLVLLAAPAWDGSFVGEGKMSDDTVVSSIFLEAILNEGVVNIACSLVAVDIPPTVASCVMPNTNSKSLDWNRIPGSSDAAKLTWLSRQFNLIPAVFFE